VVKTGLAIAAPMSWESSVVCVLWSVCIESGRVFINEISQDLAMGFLFITTVPKKNFRGN
jgi:hypothetical protein